MYLSVSPTLAFLYIDHAAPMWHTWQSPLDWGILNGLINRQIHRNWLWSLHAICSASVYHALPGEPNQQRAKMGPRSRTSSIARVRARARATESESQTGSKCVYEKKLYHKQERQWDWDLASLKARAKAKVKSWNCEMKSSKTKEVFFSDGVFVTKA